MDQNFTIWLIGAFLVFIVGIYGLITKKDGIKQLISIELLVTSTNMVFIGTGYLFSDRNTLMQSFTLLSLSVGGAIVGLGLAILTIRFQRLRSVDVTEHILLRG